MEAGVGRSGPCRGSATCGPASVDGQNMARHHSGFFRAEPHDSVRLFLSADRATNGLVLDEIVDHHLTYFSTGFVIRFRRGLPRRDAIHPYTAVRVGESSRSEESRDGTGGGHEGGSGWS